MKRQHALGYFRTKKINWANVENIKKTRGNWGLVPVINQINYAKYGEVVVIKLIDNNRDIIIHTSRFINIATYDLYQLLVKYYENSKK